MKNKKVLALITTITMAVGMAACTATTDAQSISEPISNNEIATDEITDVTSDAEPTTEITDVTPDAEPTTEITSGEIGDGDINNEISLLKENTGSSDTGNGEVIETMTVNSTDIEISCVPFAQKQELLFDNCDYYINYLEELNSPAFVNIAPASKSVFRKVTDVEVDDEENVTITVSEINADMIGANKYPITVVTIYPIPASVTVVDDNGNTLTGN